MRSFKLHLQYDGTETVGWQIQKKGRSIQRDLQRAIRKVVGHSVSCIASGRTDAGVHALAQVVHFKTKSLLPPERLLRAINVHLPSSVVIRHIEEVDSAFHAQFDAQRKTYLYLIYNSRITNVFLSRYSWQVFQELDWKAIQTAIDFLKGEHDFKSFQSVGTPVESTVRTLFKIEKIDCGFQKKIPYPIPFTNTEGLVALVFEADGFLKQMVRNLVGTLIQVGLHKIAPDQIPQILKAKDRKKAGPAAPAQGLFLVEVVYEL